MEGNALAYGRSWWTNGLETRSWCEEELNLGIWWDFLADEKKLKKYLDPIGDVWYFHVYHVELIIIQVLDRTSVYEIELEQKTDRNFIWECLLEQLVLKGLLSQDNSRTSALLSLGAANGVDTKSQIANLVLNRYPGS